MGTTIETLRQPTVGDLMQALAKLDPNEPIAIKDADTDWFLSIIHIKECVDKDCTFKYYLRVTYYDK